MADQLLHLQTAAAGRASEGTMASMIDHLVLEASAGSYPAQAAAAPVLEQAYRDLGGLLGIDEDGVAIVGGGTDVLHLTHLASHRCVSQPVAEAIALCRPAGVPVWVDAAQSLGHLDTAFDADAAYTPGRKWLEGPRGVGVMAVRESARDQLRPFRTSTDADRSASEVLRKGKRPVAAQVGLAHAVREHLQTGPSERRVALAVAGAGLRQALHHCGTPRRSGSRCGWSRCATKRFASATSTWT